jgi:hypothetical protein
LRKVNIKYINFPINKYINKLTKLYIRDGKYYVTEESDNFYGSSSVVIRVGELMWLLTRQTRKAYRIFVDKSRHLEERGP